jgi:hypothetical protein
VTNPTKIGAACVQIAYDRQMRQGGKDVRVCGALAPPVMLTFLGVAGAGILLVGFLLNTTP